MGTMHCKDKAADCFSFFLIIIRSILIDSCLPLSLPFFIKGYHIVDIHHYHHQPECCHSWLEPSNHRIIAARSETPKHARIHCRCCSTFDLSSFSRLLKPTAKTTMSRINRFKTPVMILKHNNGTRVVVRMHTGIEDDGDMAVVGGVAVQSRHIRSS